MGRFLTTDDFIRQFGEREAELIAGTGAFNSLEGSLIDAAQIDEEIAYADELIGGYVISRHTWLLDVGVADMPNLLKGLGGDIVRYRLRDKADNRGQITETIATRYKEALQRLTEISEGKLDVMRDRANGADLDTAELPEAGADVPQISGHPSQSDDTLRGY